MFLKRISLLLKGHEDVSKYPFTIASIKNLKELQLEKRVTFFVGENGSGKSTLLEAIADKCEFNTAGGGRNNLFEVDQAESALGDFIRLSWMPKATNGFFLRAESFYQFASHIDELARQDRGIYDQYGGKSLHHQSHGESFLTLFQHRFNGDALYLLDEPEAALSPARQLAFLRIIHDLTEKEDCQFIIATHSPILLGYPDADIYSFDDGEIRKVAFEDTDHFQITKYFLDNRDRFLVELFKEDEV
ncbi:AAA family ATPase [Cytobacillus gottheilii]|uniref:AAA family ATPase n=1 Tax=Cytobacillus gottheilii TaxID=859144 RepID=UPI0009B9BD21|nr:AAA family ATPase [Cytobacillus gottheilii]